MRALTQSWVGGSANFFLLAIFTLCAGNTFYARNVVARRVTSEMST